MEKFALLAFNLLLAFVLTYGWAALTGQPADAVVGWVALGLAASANAK